MLSSAVIAHCDAQLLSLAETDTGAVRTSNETTAVSQAVKFQNFCRQLDHTDFSFSHTKVSNAERLLASFAMGVSTGHFSVSRTPVGLNSVQNHVKAAASFAINASRKDPHYRYDQFGNKIGNTYFSALNSFYNSMTKWKKKSSKALPLTPPIITHLVSVVAHSFPNPNLSLKHVASAMLSSLTASLAPAAANIAVANDTLATNLAKCLSRHKPLTSLGGQSPSAPLISLF